MNFFSLLCKVAEICKNYILDNQPRTLAWAYKSVNSSIKGKQ